MGRRDAAHGGGKPGRVAGPHEPGGLLSFHGLYQGVYRMAAARRTAHLLRSTRMCRAGRAGALVR
jgi:hypothetical protein